ncbi:MAG: gluconate permease [Bryobacterales bacterium]|nr:gluconate permease [Bryobacterales bacterium]
MSPPGILAAAILLVFVLILWLRINAFLALIVAAMTVGLLSPHVEFASVMPKVAEQFGVVCGKIGIVIALAAVIGECLLESGAADKITRVFVRSLGERHASLSLLGSGFFLAIPVFFDTVFYLLVPLARSMRVRLGHGYVLFVMSICAGGVAAHVLVPPTPGPVAMAATLGIDLGLMILVGSAAAIPMGFVGWLLARRQDRVLDVPLRETSGVSLAELEKISAASEERLPPFFVSLLPIILPVILITSNTILKAVGHTGPLATAAAFLGDPNFALLASAAVAMAVLGFQKRYALSELARPVEHAFQSAGLIILITAAGGAFGAMLVEAGVGRSLGEFAAAYQLPLVFLGFALAAVIKIAQGSSTVAMITTASMLAPLMAEGDLAFHPVYVALAIGSGSLIGAWMNDSGFWVYKQMSGMTEGETLRTWTPLLALVGLTGYAVAQLGAIVLPLR